MTEFVGIKEWQVLFEWLAIKKVDKGRHHKKVYLCTQYFNFHNENITDITVIAVVFIFDGVFM